MKKKSNKKRDTSMHPINEHERVKNTIQAMINPEKSNSEPSFEFSTETRHFRLLSNIGKVKSRIDRKKGAIFW